MLNTELLSVIIPALFAMKGKKKKKKKKHCKQYIYSSTGMNKLTCIYTMGNFAILNKKNELDLYMLSCRP